MKTPSVRMRLVSAALLLAAVGCGGSDMSDGAATADADVADDPAQSMSDAAESMSAAMSQMQAAASAMADKAGADTPLIAAATLQERLPDEVDGLPQTDSERQQSGAMGFSISTANATYNDDDRRVEITITDAGGTGMMAMAGAAWASVTIDKANSDGYERTVMIDGNKGFEKETNRNGRLQTELAVIANGRLLVKLEGRDVSMDVLRDALDALRVNDIAVAR
jgi:hypothetical protein